MDNFPTLLKKIRKQASFTQTELADFLGVSKVLIAMIESGQKRPSQNFIEKLSEKLDVHPASITPFVFANKDINLNRLSSPEKALLKAGSKMQEFLVERKAAQLSKYAKRKV